MTPPANPSLFHITHVDNLKSIVQRGALLSDSRVHQQGGAALSIGMSTIKQKRLKLPVACHQELKVGDCVPFYFCPRSIMLYVIHCANHPNLSYRGGQEPIVHLEVDLGAAMNWADSNGSRWAFSLSNAGGSYAEFRSTAASLGEIDWDAVRASNFAAGATTVSGSQVREAKQAEFLLEDELPWSLVRRIGVHSQEIASRCLEALNAANHKPRVTIERAWYF